MIFQLSALFNILTKLLFDKVLGLTIFWANILELLSSETAILSWRVSFQQHSKLNSWLSVVILFQNFCNVVYIRFFERENELTE